MMPGMPEKRTHDYVRHGTTSLFAAFNTADGTVISSLHRRHRAIEFKKFLTKIDSQVPADLDVHLICDNYGTHKSPGHQDMAGRPPPVPHALHPDLFQLAQPGRTVVRLRHRRPAPPQRPPQRPSTGEADIRAWVKAWNDEPEAVHLDQDRRPDPRIHSDDFCNESTGAGH